MLIKAFRSWLFFLAQGSSPSSLYTNFKVWKCLKCWTWEFLVSSFFCIGTTSIFSGEFVNIKLTYQYTTGKYGKVGSSYFWHCQCLFLMFWVNSWFSVGSYGNAESSWAQVWGPPSLGHWWLQEQYWYFSRKLCRGHFFLSGTFWLWWRVLWTREPSCPTMEWPRNENQLQLCVNNWVLSKTSAEQKQYSAI